MELNLNKPENQKANQNQNQKSPELIAAEQENSFLKEQLSKQLNDQESLTLQKEAEKLEQNQAALIKEADLRQALGEQFTQVKAGLKPDEEISQEQLIAIMGEAVEASSNAQGSLILNKVAAMMKDSNAKLEKTQKLLVDLAAGVSMQQVRNANPDYDQYKTEVAQIMGSTRGLSTADAYLLAKAQKSKGQPNQREIETERPNNPPSPAPGESRNDYTNNNQHEQQAPQGNPRQVFLKASRAAIDKIIGARTG